MALLLLALLVASPCTPDHAPGYRTCSSTFACFPFQRTNSKSGHSATGSSTPCIELILFRLFLALAFGWVNNRVLGQGRQCDSY